MDRLAFYKILKLRFDIFVVEQERIYHELDEEDLKAVHIFHVNEEEGVNAYSRVFEEKTKVVFGRLVTAPSARGKGLGSRLVEEILNLCAEKWPEKSLRLKSRSRS